MAQTNLDITMWCMKTRTLCLFVTLDQFKRKKNPHCFVKHLLHQESTNWGQLKHKLMFYIPKCLPTNIKDILSIKIHFSRLTQWNHNTQVVQRRTPYNYGHYQTKPDWAPNIFHIQNLSSCEFNSYLRNINKTLQCCQMRYSYYWPSFNQVNKQICSYL